MFNPEKKSRMKEGFIGQIIYFTIINYLEDYFMSSICIN